MDGKTLVRLMQRNIRDFASAKGLDYEEQRALKQAIMDLYDRSPETAGKMTLEEIIDKAYGTLPVDNRSDDLEAQADIEHLFRPVRPEVAARKTNEQEGWGAW